MLFVLVCLFLFFDFFRSSVARQGLVQSSSSTPPYPPPHPPSPAPSRPPPHSLFFSSSFSPSLRPPPSVLALIGDCQALFSLAYEGPIPLPFDQTFAVQCIIVTTTLTPSPSTQVLMCTAPGSLAAATEKVLWSPRLPSCHQQSTGTTGTQL